MVHGSGKFHRRKLCDRRFGLSRKVAMQKSVKCKQKRKYQKAVSESKDISDNFTEILLIKVRYLQSYILEF